MTFRFDEFRLEGDTRRLLHQDREVHLSPKAFDLLHALIEHRARAMSRTELHERLWPSTFVQDSNLAGLAAEVRRALDDSADEPRYLRTVPRFGYWFIGQVTDGATPPSDRSPARCWLLWAGRQIALELGENILGRAPDATVWIDAASVSRQHARIRIDGTSAVLEDSGQQERHVPARRAVDRTTAPDGRRRDPARLRRRHFPHSLTHRRDRQRTGVKSAMEVRRGEARLRSGVKGA